jgi:hypothetical protein
MRDEEWRAIAGLRKLSPVEHQFVISTGSKRFELSLGRVRQARREISPLGRNDNLPVTLSRRDDFDQDRFRVGTPAKGQHDAAQPA